MIASRKSILTDLNKLGLLYRIKSDLRKRDWQKDFHWVSIGNELLIAETSTIVIRGLALAKSSRIGKIRLIADGHSFDARINIPSPELGNQLPEVQGSLTSKWTCRVKLPAPPIANFKLNLEIVLENSNTANLGEFQVLHTQAPHLSQHSRGIEFVEGASAKLISQNRINVLQKIFSASDFLRLPLFWFRPSWVRDADIGDKNAQLFMAISTIQESRELMLQRIAKGQGYVFIAGNPRSGTSALCQLLNLSPALCIGMERYAVGQNISAMFFEEQNFFDPEDERYSRKPVLYEPLKPKFGSARYIGDKIPRFNLTWKSVFLNLPSAKIIYIFRNIYDVATSYNERARRAASGLDQSWTPSQDHTVAVNDWNRTLNDVQDMARATQVYFVRYEDIFLDKSKISDLFSYLGVNIDCPEISESIENIRRSALVLREKKRSLSTEEKNYIDSHADFAAYEQVLKLYERQ